MPRQSPTLGVPHGARAERDLRGTLPIERRETARRLRVFVSDPKALVAQVTPSYGEELYAAFREGRSVAYHRAVLINARSLLKWYTRVGLADEPVSEGAPTRAPPERGEGLATAPPREPVAPLRIELRTLRV